ncbi:MAG TPA: hypothetical protein VHV55_25705 [Pirellulales bacterium]|jgi:hypothetical protein|nr:hypothetical protein [Pirellulales bacterium]
MGVFTELIVPGVSPGKEQQYAREHFASAVAQSTFTLWSPVMLIGGDSMSIVIGVAVYAPNELGLLDRIDFVLGRMAPAQRPFVGVFETSICASHEAFEALIPGLGKVLQTPVVGVWKNRVFQQSRQGFSAIELLREIFRSPGPANLE